MPKSKCEGGSCVSSLSLFLERTGESYPCLQWLASLCGFTSSRSHLQTVEPKEEEKNTRMRRRLEQGVNNRGIPLGWRYRGLTLTTFVHNLLLGIFQSCDLCIYTGVSCRLEWSPCPRTRNTKKVRPYHHIYLSSFSFLRGG
jgi:hypothetical protein